MTSFFCLVACTLTLCPDLSASRLPSGGGVCVDPLESRGSFRIGFSFQLLAGTGGQEAHRAVPNEALYGDLRICSLISCTYLLF